MNYETNLTRSARKDYLDLPRGLSARITSAIDGLEINPRPRGVRKLHGDDNLWRIRVGDYRIIYEIDDDTHQILIHRIKNRRESY